MNGPQTPSSDVQRLLETEQRVGRAAVANAMRLAVDSVQRAQALPTAEVLSLAHHYKAAISLVERHAEWWRAAPSETFRAAAIYYVCRQPRRAIELLEDLRRLRPNDPGLLTELAVAHVSIGELETARRHLDAAMLAEPKWIPALHELALLSRVTEEGAVLRHLQAALKDQERLPPHWVVRLHYALGKSYDDLGDYERAWDAYATGARRAFVSQEESARRVHDQAIEVSRLAPPPKAPTATDTVFIVGMPRSGTTLVEQVLLGADDSSSLGESPAFYQSVRHWLRSADAEALNRLWDEQRLRALNQSYRLYWPEYEERHASVMIDKTPANYLWAATAARAFPGARIIHCKRDPLEICWSLYTTWFGAGTAWSYDLNSVANAYNRYHTFTSEWHGWLGEALIEVEHEAMASDAVACSQALFHRAGLSWNPAVVDTAGRTRPVVTPSMGQVRRSIGDLTLRRHESYRDKLGPLIDRLSTAASSV